MLWTGPAEAGDTRFFVSRGYVHVIGNPRGIGKSEGGGSREVTGAELGGLLAGKGVPAVILNACQSGMTHPEALYPSRLLADHHRHFTRPDVVVIRHPVVACVA